MEDPPRLCCKKSVWYIAVRNLIRKALKRNLYFDIITPLIYWKC